MRARPRIVASLLLVVALAPVMTGCFRRQFPERRLYVLNVARTEVARSRSSAVLRLSRVRAEPQYERKGFVYRTGESTYADDFYNAFYMSPEQIVRSTMHEWLAASGVFAMVADVDSLVGVDWVLESRLMDFYVDKRLAGDERAVVRLAVTLVDARRSPPRAMLERTYEEVASAAGGGQGYIDAWSAALTRVYARMEDDLASTLSARGSP
jgi:ABC-type uncharacterized transport system auxiliary subunit